MNSIMLGASYIGKALLYAGCLWGIIIPIILVCTNRKLVEKKLFYFPQTFFLAVVLFILLSTGLIGNPWHLYEFHNISFHILPETTDELKQTSLNVAMFIPFGLMLPLAVPKVRKWYLVFGTGLLFSIAIETLQVLFIGRSGEVGDIIANSIGTIIGYGLFSLTLTLRRNSNKTIGLGTCSLFFVFLGVLTGWPIRHVTVGDIWINAGPLSVQGLYRGIHYGELIAIIFFTIGYLLSHFYSEDYSAKTAKIMSISFGSMSLVVFIASFFFVI